MKKVCIFLAPFPLLYLMMFAICLTPYGNYTTTWVRNMYVVKDFLLSQPSTKRRLIFVSGSNSRFGFESGLIDKETPYKPINYAVHVGVPFNFLVHKIMQNVRAGDIVILPLEFEYYTSQPPNGNYEYIQNMLVWGQGYFEFVEISKILKLPFKNNLKHIFFQWLRDERTMPSEADVIKTMQDIWRQDTHHWYGALDYRTLNQYGDFSAQGVIKSIQAEYFSENITPSLFFIEQFHKLQAFAAGNGITLILTYPVTAENPLFSIHDKRTFQKIERLKSQLAQHGIHIRGNFLDSHFEKDFFFDTLYHLNAKGAHLRTQNFIHALPALLDE